MMAQASWLLCQEWQWEGGKPHLMEKLTRAREKVVTPIGDQGVVHVREDLPHRSLATVATANQ